MRLWTGECASGRRARRRPPPPLRCPSRPNSTPSTVALICAAAAIIVAGAPQDGHCMCPDIGTDIADGVATISRRSPASATGQTGFNVTDSIAYSCNIGHHVSGMSAAGTTLTLSCQDNNQWNGTVPSCIIVNCGQGFPDQTTGTAQISISGSGETYGSTRTLRCKISGYHVFGLLNNVTQLVATCQANGLWSETSFPGCALVECSDLYLDLPPDANLTAIPPHNLEFTIYTRLMVTCPLGAYVETTNTSSASVYCANVGAWRLEVPPNFSRIPLPLPICTVPPAPSASTAAPTASSAGSTVTRSPTTGSTVAQSPTGAALDCDDPAQLISNASIDGLDFSVNSSVTVACDEGLHIGGDVGRGNVTALQCGDSGEWLPGLPRCALAPGSSGGTNPASTSPAITSGVNLPQAADTSNALLSVAIAVPCAILLLALVTLLAICWRRRQLRKQPCEPWSRRSSQQLTLLDRGHDGQANNGVVGSQMQENATLPADRQSELFDDPLYYQHSTRSFEGQVTEDNYGRIQANTLYSSPVSPMRSNLGSLPSPPRDVAPDDAAGRHGRSAAAADADPMALYNSPVPSSPPFYHTVKVEGDGDGGGGGDDSPALISPYMHVTGSAAAAAAAAAAVAAVVDAGQHSYNTVRQPPRRWVPGDEDVGGRGVSSSAATTTTVSPPLYFCLENVSPLLDEKDNTLATDDDGYLADAGMLRRATDDASSRPSAPSSAGESSDNENRRPSRLTAQMYSVPHKAPRSRSRTPRDATEGNASAGGEQKATAAAAATVEHRSNRRTIQELDEVSSAAASMLRRQRSRSMPAAERKERRRLYMEKLRDVSHDSDPTSSSRGGSRPKPSFPFPPPPRRDSLATGRRALTATTSHPANVTSPRSLSVPRQRHRSKSDGHTSKRKNKDGADEVRAPCRNILLDDSLLELTTDL